MIARQWTSIADQFPYSLDSDDAELQAGRLVQLVTAECDIAFPSKKPLRDGKKPILVEQRLRIDASGVRLSLLEIS